MREMWRVDVAGTEAGAPPGCGNECFYAIDVAGRDKPARPPAAGTNATWNEIGVPPALHDHLQAICGLDGLHVGH